MGQCSQVSNKLSVSLFEMKFVKVTPVATASRSAMYQSELEAKKM